MPDNVVNMPYGLLSHPITLRVQQQIAAEQQGQIGNKKHIPSHLHDGMGYKVLVLQLNT